MTKKTIKLRINELLESRSISTAEFVKRTGLAYNTALGLRRGVVTRIDLDVLARVCDILEVQPGDLFELKEING